MNKLNKILEYGLYLLVFLLPVQTRYIARSFEVGRGNLKAGLEYGNISLYGTDILLIALLVLWAIIFFKSKNNQPAGELRDPYSGNEPHPSPLLYKERGCWLILAGLDFFIFLSIFFASDKILALYRYGVFLLGIGLAFLIIKTSYNFNKLLWSFFGGVFLSACLGIWQFLNQSALASKWLGLAAHAPSDLGASVIEAAGVDGALERWLRAYGLFDHPNILGGVLAVGLVILIYWFVNEKQLSLRGVPRLRDDEAISVQPPQTRDCFATRQRRSARNDKIFFAFYFSFFALFAGLVFSFSRAAALSFVAAFILLFIINIWQKNYPAIKKLSGLAVLGIVLFGIIFSSYGNLFLTRAQGAGRLEDKSTNERKLYLEDAKKVIKKNWLFGVGIGNYSNEIIKSNPKRYAWEVQPPHNTFVLVWVEVGLLGLLFFIAILGCLAWQGIKSKNLIILPILLGLVIIISLDHWLWSLHFGVLFFWLIIGLLLKMSKEKNKVKSVEIISK